MSAHHRPRLDGPTLVTLAYVAAATAWIMLSDWLVAVAVPPAAFRWVSTAKGAGFVLVTALVLWVALRAGRRRERAADARALAAERQELSEVRRLQGETLRTNRALRVLLEANEALVRARSEAELLREICRSAVETGGLAFAWVGEVEHDPGKRIREVARFGPHDAYADGLRLTWADEERGRGPAGTAIRERRVVVFDDHAREPRFAPWREKARAHGFTGSIALPLVHGDDCFGVLAFYAKEEDAFQGPIVPLLTQLAGDLAYGLTALRTRVALAASREEMRALATRVEEIREEEKARLARDLHDDMGQLLTAAKMDLGFLERRILELPEGPAAGAMLDRTLEAAELLDEAVAAVRRIAAELRPLALDQLGLAAALRQEGRRFAERTGIRCAVDAPDVLRLLPPPLVTAVYRIFQESLTNVARHAAATEVRVALALRGDAVQLTVEDDGRGLPDLAGRGRGLGLVGMRERAERLGGAVVVEAAARGTRVTATLPLPAGGAAA